MTNFDKWKEKIGELKWNFAVVNGVPCNCNSLPCNDCLFNADAFCSGRRWRWLWEEYKEYEEPNLKRIIDVDEFVAYLESEIAELERLENVDADNGEYAGAIGRHAYANAFHELLGLITLDNPPEWVKVKEE